MDNTARLVSKNQSQKPNRYHGAGGVARYGLPMHESLGPSFNTKEKGTKRNRGGLLKVYFNHKPGKYKTKPYLYLGAA
jgi:hypothetical protein